MAFNINAEIILSGPKNLRNIRQKIEESLSNVRVNITPRITARTLNQQLAGLSDKIKNVKVGVDIQPPNASGIRSFRRAITNKLSTDAIKVPISVNRNSLRSLRSELKEVVDEEIAVKTSISLTKDTRSKLGSAVKQSVSNVPVSVTGPTNSSLAAVRDKTVEQLKFIPVKIELVASRKISGLEDKLKNINSLLLEVSKSAKLASVELARMSESLPNVKVQERALSKFQQTMGTTGSVTRKSTSAINEFRDEIEAFSHDAALAVRRFTAFTLATTVIFGFARAIQQSVVAGIDFERRFVRVAQVARASASQMSALRKTIDDLSISLGIDANELVDISRIFAQTGQSIEQVRASLEAVAKASLAPTFNSIETVTEGLIAALFQFDLQASESSAVLDQINAISKNFAVEAEDLIAVIRRTGGVFVAASGDIREPQRALAELLSIFTAVRSTTRETAETIATGLRTIISRLQRPVTIEFLKQFNIQLTETRDGVTKFVGVFRALQEISDGLERLFEVGDTLAVARIVEELGGIRQVGKLIPAIREFDKAQQALNVALNSTGSISQDVDLALQNLSVRAEQTRERFKQLFRSIVQSTEFQNVAGGLLSIANALISAADAIRPILPALTALLSQKVAKGAVSLFSGFTEGLKKLRDGVGAVADTRKQIGELTTAQKRIIRVTSRHTLALNRNSDVLEGFFTELAKLVVAFDNLTITVADLSHNLNAANSLLHTLITEGVKLEITGGPPPGGPPPSGPPTSGPPTGPTRPSGPSNVEPAGPPPEPKEPEPPKQVKEPTTERNQPVNVPGRGRGQIIISSPNVKVNTPNAPTKVPTPPPQESIKRLGRQGQILTTKFPIPLAAFDLGKEQERDFAQEFASLIEEITGKTRDKFSSTLQDAIISAARDRAVRQSVSQILAAGDVVKDVNRFEGGKPGKIRASDITRSFGRVPNIDIEEKHIDALRAVDNNTQRVIVDLKTIATLFGTDLPSALRSAVRGIIDVIRGVNAGQIKLSQQAQQKGVGSFLQQLQQSIQETGQTPRVIGAIGPAGAGKSTTFEQLGAIRPQTPEQFIDLLRSGNIELVVESAATTLQESQNALLRLIDAAAKTGGEILSFTDLTEEQLLQYRQQAINILNELGLEKVAQTLRFAPTTIPKDVQAVVAQLSKEVNVPFRRIKRKHGGPIPESSEDTSLTPVALTPGEIVVLPDAVKKIGVNNLRKFNQTGDLEPILKRGAPAGSFLRVDGFGNADTVETALPPNSFVVKKDSVQKAGLESLVQSSVRVQKFRSGGVVKRQQGGSVPIKDEADFFKALIKANVPSQEVEDRRLQILKELEAKRTKDVNDALRNLGVNASQAGFQLLFLSQLVQGIDFSSFESSINSITLLAIGLQSIFDIITSIKTTFDTIKRINTTFDAIVRLNERASSAVKSEAVQETVKAATKATTSSTAEKTFARIPKLFSRITTERPDKQNFPSKAVEAFRSVIAGTFRSKTFRLIPKPASLTAPAIPPSVKQQFGEPIKTIIGSLTKLFDVTTEQFRDQEPKIKKVVIDGVSRVSENVVIGMKRIVEPFVEAGDTIVRVSGDEVANADKIANAVTRLATTVEGTTSDLVSQIDIAAAQAVLPQSFIIDAASGTPIETNIAPPVPPPVLPPRTPELPEPSKQLNLDRLPRPFAAAIEKLVSLSKKVQDSGKKLFERISALNQRAGELGRNIASGVASLPKKIFNFDTLVRPLLKIGDIIASPKQSIIAGSKNILDIAKTIRQQLVAFGDILGRIDFSPAISRVSEIFASLPPKAASAGKALLSAATDISGKISDFVQRVGKSGVDSVKNIDFSPLFKAIDVVASLPQRLAVGGRSLLTAATGLRGQIQDFVKELGKSALEKIGSIDFTAVTRPLLQTADVIASLPQRIIAGSKSFISAANNIRSQIEGFGKKIGQVSLDKLKELPDVVENITEFTSKIRSLPLPSKQAATTFFAPITTGFKGAAKATTSAITKFFGTLKTIVTKTLTTKVGGIALIISSLLAGAIVDGITASILGARKEISGIKGFETATPEQAGRAGGVRGGVVGAIGGAGVGALILGPVGAAIGLIVGSLTGAIVGFFKGLSNQIKFDALSELSSTAQQANTAFQNYLRVLDNANTTTEQVVLALDKVANSANALASVLVSTPQTLANANTQAISGFPSIVQDVASLTGAISDAIRSQDTFIGKVGAFFGVGAVRNVQVGGVRGRGEDINKALGAIPEETLANAERVFLRLRESLIEAIPLSSIERVASLDPSSSFTDLIGALEEVGPKTEQYKKQLEAFSAVLTTVAIKQQKTQAQFLQASGAGANETISGAFAIAGAAFSKGLQTGDINKAQEEATRSLVESLNAVRVAGSSIDLGDVVGSFTDLTRLIDDFDTGSDEAKNTFAALGSALGLSTASVVALFRATANLGRETERVAVEETILAQRAKLMNRILQLSTKSIDALAVAMNKLQQNVTVAVNGFGIAVSNVQASIQNALSSTQQIPVFQQQNVFTSSGANRSIQELESGVDRIRTALGGTEENFKDLASSVKLGQELPVALKKVISDLERSGTAEITFPNLEKALVEKLPSLENVSDTVRRRFFGILEAIFKGGREGAELGLTEFKKILEETGSIEQLTEISDRLASGLEAVTSQLNTFRDAVLQSSDLIVQASRIQADAQLKILSLEQDTRARFARFQTIDTTPIQDAFRDLRQRIQTQLNFGGAGQVQPLPTDVLDPQQLLQRQANLQAAIDQQLSDLGLEISGEQVGTAEFDKALSELVNQNLPDHMLQLVNELGTNVAALEGTKQALETLSSDTSRLAAVEQRLSAIQEQRLSARQRFSARINELAGARSPQDVQRILQDLARPLQAALKAQNNIPITVQEAAALTASLDRGVTGVVARGLGLNEANVEISRANVQQAGINLFQTLFDLLGVRRGFSRGVVEAQFGQGAERARGTTEEEKKLLSLKDKLIKDTKTVIEGVAQANVDIIKNREQVLRHELLLTAERLKDAADGFRALREEQEKEVEQLARLQEAQANINRQKEGKRVSSELQAKEEELKQLEQQAQTNNADIQAQADKLVQLITNIQRRRSGEDEFESLATALDAVATFARSSGNVRAQFDVANLRGLLDVKNVRNLNEAQVQQLNSLFDVIASEATANQADAKFIADAFKSRFEKLRASGQSGEAVASVLDAVLKGALRSIAINGSDFKPKPEDRQKIEELKKEIADLRKQKDELSKPVRVTPEVRTTPTPTSETRPAPAPAPPPAPATAPTPETRPAPTTPPAPAPAPAPQPRPAPISQRVPATRPTPVPKFEAILQDVEKQIAELDKALGPPSEALAASVKLATTPQKQLRQPKLGLKEEQKRVLEDKTVFKQGIQSLTKEQRRRARDVGLRLGTRREATQSLTALDNKISSLVEQIKVEQDPRKEAILRTQLQKLELTRQQRQGVFAEIFGAAPVPTPPVPPQGGEELARREAAGVRVETQTDVLNQIAAIDEKIKDKLNQSVVSPSKRDESLNEVKRLMEEREKLLAQTPEGAVVKSIEDQLSSAITQLATAFTPEEKRAAQQQIQALQQRRNEVLTGVRTPRDELRAIDQEIQRRREQLTAAAPEESRTIQQQIEQLQNRRQQISSGVLSTTNDVKQQLAASVNIREAAAAFNTGATNLVNTVNSLTTSLQPIVNEMSRTVDRLQSLESIQVSVNARVGPVEVVLNGAQLLNDISTAVKNDVLVLVGEKLQAMGLVRNAAGELTPPELA